MKYLGLGEINEMIEIEKAKQELKTYVKEQNIQNPRALKKLEHIMRVAKISKEIATELKLTQEQIQLAELIGLLHDIGRFKQYQIVNQNLNLDVVKKFNHGEAGVEILKKDNNIRRYILKNEYDDVIYTAVYEHNRYELSEGLTKEKELFCKIIKDADKIDLMYEAIAVYWQKPEDIREIECGTLSERMLQDFYQHKLADNRNKVSRTDEILRFTSFVFDMNFLYSIQVVKRNNYINQIIDRFHYQLPETKEEMTKIKKMANEYIGEKIKDKNEEER